jgi:transposase
VAADRVRLQKKRARPAAQDNPIVQAERRAFRDWIGRVDGRRLVFLDESGANLAMGRSHAWVPRGRVLVEPRPRNWGDNLTLVGAMRVDCWLTVATKWGAMTTSRFIEWVQRRLVPRLRRRDIVVLDNLAAHQARRVRTLIEQAGATVRVLPPYSQDFNPIEAAWALIKKRIRAVAPRTGRDLRRTAQRAGRVVRQRHCQNWCAHAGYCYQRK